MAQTKSTWTATLSLTLKVPLKKQAVEIISVNVTFIWAVSPGRTCLLNFAPPIRVRTGNWRPSPVPERFLLAMSSAPLWKRAKRYRKNRSRSSRRGGASTPPSRTSSHAPSHSTRLGATVTPLKNSRNWGARAMRRNMRPGRLRPAWFNCTDLRPYRLPSTNWQASFFEIQKKSSRFNLLSPRKCLNATAAITAGCFFVMWDATRAFLPRSAAASLPLRMNWMPLIPPPLQDLRPGRALIPTAPTRAPDPDSTGSGTPQKPWVAGCSQSVGPRDGSPELKFSM